MFPTHFCAKLQTFQKCFLFTSRCFTSEIARTNFSCLNNYQKNTLDYYQNFTFCNIKRNYSTTEFDEQQIISSSKLLVNSSNFEPKSLEELEKLLVIENFTEKTSNVFQNNVNNLSDLDDIAPEVRSTFNMAAHVNKSESLQQLVKLGVNIGKFDTNLEIASMVLSVTSEEIKALCLFLHNLSIPTKNFGRIITNAPELLKEDQSLLTSRINYLVVKNFPTESIARIISSSPQWLLYSISEIDSILGYYQKTFSLSGSEVRILATKAPTMITGYNKTRIEENRLTISRSYEYEDEEMKQILLRTPKVLSDHPDNLSSKLHLLHHKMCVPRQLVVAFSQILTTRTYRIDDRHYFLKSLGRAQYDPSLPKYVCLKDVAVLSDEDFAVNVAMSSVQAFDAYMLTA